MDAMKLLSSLLRGKSLSSALGSELLGGLMGGGGSSSRSGGLGGMLGGLLGGGSSSSKGGSGMLGGLLGSVMGGGAAAGGLGGLLGSVMGGGDAPEPQAASDQNDQAVVMIRAMVNAAKSDGRVDSAEQEKIISNLGDDVSQSEIEFLKSEFSAPLDVAGFVSSVPKGMEQDVYVMSLTSIDLDTQNEAKYLGQLAQSLSLDPAWCNQVHEQVGAPTIFS